MIFNTFAYFFLFLLPAATLFRLAGPQLRPWVCVASGIGFFAYFSITALAGLVGASCLLIFVWEALISRFYRPRSAWCLVGVAISVTILGAFKYANFATDLIYAPLGSNPWHWDQAFLPLGISFFTFEFIHYAVDRYHDRTEAGTLGEYLAFIFFFPTMVAGPIKRFPDFLPCLRAPSEDWALDWNRGITRIMVGLVKKFALADLFDQPDRPPHRRRHRPRRALGPTDLVGCLRLEDLLRLLRLLRHRHRLGPPLRPPDSRELRLALLPDQYRRILAALAHLALPLAGRLCVHPAGRLTWGPAWTAYRNVLIVMLVSGLWHGRGVELPGLGSLARHPVGDPPRLVTPPTLDLEASRPHLGRPLDELGINLRRRKSGLGLFRHGSTDGRPFLPPAFLGGNVMDRLTWWKHTLEYLGGERDVPPAGLYLVPQSPAWGLWWGILTTLIALFCGQASKFIYIDF